MGVEDGNVLTTRLEPMIDWFKRRLGDPMLGWGRRFSLFQYPFATACCAMEYMSVMASHYDLARFGAEVPRFSPRQADMMMVVGTVTHKLAPVMRRVYDSMCEPKWVVSFGVCASSGGFYDNYATVQGIDTIIPVDVYIPGCPPRPEQVLDALLLLQEKIEDGDSGGQRDPNLEVGPPPPALDPDFKLGKR